MKSYTIWWHSKKTGSVYRSLVYGRNLESAKNRMKQTFGVKYVFNDSRFNGNAPKNARAGIEVTE